MTSTDRKEPPKLTRKERRAPARADRRQRQQAWLRAHGPTWAAVAITAIALTESYLTLVAVGDKGHSKLPWLFPIPIDLLDLMFVVLLARQRGKSMREVWPLWVSLAGLTAFSVTLQVGLLDQPFSDLRALAVAASSPILAVVGIKASQHFGHLDATPVELGASTSSIRATAPDLGQASPSEVDGMTRPTSTVSYEEAVSIAALSTDDVDGPVVSSLAESRPRLVDPLTVDGQWTQAAEAYIAANALPDKDKATARAVAERLDGGLPKTTIASQIDVSRQSVYNWQTKFRAFVDGGAEAAG